MSEREHMSRNGSTAAKPRAKRTTPTAAKPAPEPTAGLSVRVRKVVYQVHMDQVDADGNVVQEVSTQEPITLYGHQLGDLSAQVAAVVAQAEQQADAI